MKMNELVFTVRNAIRFSLIQCSAKSNRNSNASATA